MGAFHIVGERLSDVVQKTCPTCQRCVHTQLLRHNTGEDSHLNGVLQDVLTVACPVAQTSQQAHQIGIDTVNVDLKCCAFASLLEGGVHVLLGFFHHFLNAGRVDASVRDELFQRQPGNLAADGVKA